MNRIPYGRHSIDEIDIDAVVDVLRHGWLTQGPAVVEFENAVADYVGAKYAVAVSNGTAALHLAYLAVGVKEGDAVVTSPNTFVATANGARYCGANVHFVDIDPDSLNMDVELLEQKCDDLKGVKVITPVHFAGLPCDMKKVTSIAEQVGSRVIEDAAHALGAVYEDGSRVGNCRFSDITTFSFHPVKMIAAGEGGMLTTNDEDLYRELLRLRSHGINKGHDEYLDSEAAYTNGEENPWYYEMQELGYNYRITDIQSALAKSQLSKLDLFLERRKELVRNYDAAFSGHKTISLPQTGRQRELSAHHLYVLRIDFEAIGLSRKDVMKKLADKGIGTQVHYIPVHRQPYYKKINKDELSLPRVESYYQEALSIPLYYSLENEQQQFVINAVNEVLAS